MYTSHTFLKLLSENVKVACQSNSMFHVAHISQVKENVVCGVEGVTLSGYFGSEIQLNYSRGF